jgi:hypothetical protein
MESTQLVIADSPSFSSAAPATSTGESAAQLRRRLADAIAAKNAAADRAASAMQVAARAEDAMREASMIVDQIKREIHAIQRDAREAHATACVQALRADLPVPGSFTLPEGDSAALAAATAQMDALQQSARQLSTEAQVARDEVAAAADAVRILDDQIKLERWRDKGRQWIAAKKLGDELLDELVGLVRLRPDLIPHTEQEAILAEGNQRKRAIAEDGLNLEQHHYDAFLDRKAAEQEKRWLDFERRLQNDPNASFGEEGLPQ